MQDVSLVPAGNPLLQLGRRYKSHLAGSLLAPLGSLPMHRLSSLCIHSGTAGDCGCYYTPDTGRPQLADSKTHMSVLF